jgi:hypothetical protein
MAGPAVMGPKHLDLDSYAPWDIAREYGLGAHETLVLIALTLLADWRDQSYRCTKVEVAEHARTTTGTVSKALDKLKACGLIEVVKPFMRHGDGVIRVVCYAQMLNPKCALYARLMNGICAPNDGNRAYDQGKSGASRYSGKREVEGFHARNGSHRREAAHHVPAYGAFVDEPSPSDDDGAAADEFAEPFDDGYFDPHAPAYDDDGRPFTEHEVATKVHATFPGTRQANESRA